MTRPPFTAMDFPLYDSLPVRDVLPVLEKPVGIGQVAAMGRLLRRFLSRADRKKFDKMSLSQFLRLMNEYMEMSSVMGDIHMERHIASRKELDGYDNEFDSGDYPD